MGQFTRVLSVAKRKYLTLREIETECFNRFGVHDSQAAISARLRDRARLAKEGYEKFSLIRVINGKRVWFYKLFKLSKNETIN